MGKVLPASSNLFADPGASDVSVLGRPDPFENAQDFAEAVEAGEINLKHVENCHACVLKVGAFYIQRPAIGSPHLLDVVCVKKIIFSDGADTLQWGAWIQSWELATFGDPDACYITDPWVASALQMDGQRYDASKTMAGQMWTYAASPLNEFQEEIKLNVHWSKPKGQHTLSFVHPHEYTYV